MVEGGKTPPKSAAELEALGFKLVIFPGGTARALVHCLQDYFVSLKQHGTTQPWRARMVDFAEIAKSRFEPSFPSYLLHNFLKSPSLSNSSKNRASRKSSGLACLAFGSFSANSPRMISMPFLLTYGMLSI